MTKNSLCALLLLLPFAVQAQAWSLQQLLQGFSAVGERHAVYRESQQMAMLDIPLESHGTLLFRAPDYLEKQVAEGGGSYRVEGQMLHIEEAGETHSLSLQSYPALAAFVASLRAVLGGDRQMLERYYRVSLAGGQEAWSLQLEPLQKDMAALVQTITVRGSGNTISEIVTLSRGGDITRTSLGEANEN